MRRSSTAPSGWPTRPATPPTTSATCTRPTARRWSATSRAYACPASRSPSPPTVPPELDVEAWERSLDLVAGWRPARLAITHYGAAEDPELQLEACRTALREHVRLAERTDAEGFVAALRERARAEAGPAADALLQAAPPELLYLGLERWQDRRKAA